MASTHDLYQQTLSQGVLTLQVGDKPMFTAPLWYFPCGGGVFGFDSAEPILNLGQPSGEAIMKLARPIVIPVRQNFLACIEFFPTGTTNALDLLNEDGGDTRIVQVFVCGLQTRDVQ